MTRPQILKRLKQIHALITDSHLVYTSGRHGSDYVNKDAIYPHTRLISQLCKVIARQFSNSDVEVVMAPAIGGVILSQWIASHLSQMRKREVLAVYAEKSGEDFIVGRGYADLVKDKRVLVVEDVLTTGGSVKKVVQATREKGGTVVGVGALCNRGGITAKELGDIPKLMALLEINLESWDANACPLCRKKIPINTDVGKGREFLKKKK